jgi:hypothetical protein
MARNHDETWNTVNVAKKQVLEGTEITKLQYFRFISQISLMSTKNS